MVCSNRPRVVVTGMGGITPLALNVPDTWKGLLAGHSGVAQITNFDVSELPCKIAAEVKNFDPKNYMDFKDARRMARGSQMAIAAAQEAMNDAGLEIPVVDEERTGVLIGSGIGGFVQAENALQIYREKGYRSVSPFALVSSLANMPSYHVSLTIQSKGPLSTVVAACATGTQSIGEASEWIRRGAADVVVAGGVEESVQVGAVVGFIAMRALSLRNDEPEKASRPFDADRDGFVIGEGACVVVLEKLEHAMQRGARIYAEVLGQAASSDAYHSAAPDPTGSGASRAMRWALKDAGIEPDQVDYINAHGSSTPLNDAIETQAIKGIFGDHAYKLVVNSTKSMIGHMMGAAGAIEAITCILSIRDGIVHPTINYSTPDPECDLDYVPNIARKRTVNIAMSNSFGLGGQNACLVLGKFIE
ncbi:MAG: beta-ketoacyl-ACP synthase II [Anaerolineales bacterium]|nr:beta-ketoacyl-ACP synthase II [Anaerolineales bacterium]